MRTASDAAAPKRSNLFLRVASALVLFPIAVWFTLRGGLAFAFLCAAAAALAAGELVAMFQRRIGPGEAFGIAVAGSIPLATTLAGGVDLFPGWFGLALACATVALLIAFLFSGAGLDEVPRSLAVVSLGWLYCGLLVATVVGLRLRFDWEWVILAFVVTWGNDTFAYFAGRAFGRHKLMERVSPKKTWEGFAGGTLGSFLAPFAVKALLGMDDLSPQVALAIGAGGAVLGPLGDLAESMVKRAAGVKDSGQIIPGHGGLLDRIDALLFVAPWIYACAAYLR